MEEDGVDKSQGRQTDLHEEEISNRDGEKKKELYRYVRNI